MSASVDPGRVLRRAIVGWGLGHAALGQREVGAALLAAELLGLALVGAACATLADTTWYLVPFVMGSAFLVAWTAQAVHAYRTRSAAAGAIPPTPRGSAAAVAAWLAVPLLLWGTAFWLVAATAATPGAVLDRFLTAWPEGSGRSAALAAVTDQPDRLAGLADAVLDDLRLRCAAGTLTSDCGDARANLLRGVRVRVEEGATRRARHRGGGARALRAPAGPLPRHRRRERAGADSRWRSCSTSTSRRGRRRCPVVSSWGAAVDDRERDAAMKGRFIA